MKHFNDFLNNLQESRKNLPRKISIGDKIKIDDDTEMGFTDISLTVENIYIDTSASGKGTPMVAVQVTFTDETGTKMDVSEVQTFDQIVSAYFRK